MTAVSELDQLRQQNSLLLKRLLTVSRERDALAAKLAALTPPRRCRRTMRRPDDRHRLRARPTKLADWVAIALRLRNPNPHRRVVREVPDIGRTYFIVPLFTLSGLGLFNHPDIEVQWFETPAEAGAWGDADIERLRFEVREAWREWEEAR